MKTLRWIPSAVLWVLGGCRLIGFHRVRVSGILRHERHLRHGCGNAVMVCVTGEIACVTGFGVASYCRGEFASRCIQLDESAAPMTVVTQMTQIPGGRCAPVFVLLMDTSRRVNQCGNGSLERLGEVGPRGYNAGQFGVGNGTRPRRHQYGHLAV